MKLISIQFTSADLNHLLGLIASNERDGTYTVPKYQYWGRSERIKNKLESGIIILAGKVAR